MRPTARCGQKGGWKERHYIEGHFRMYYYYFTGEWCGSEAQVRQCYHGTQTSTSVLRSSLEIPLRHGDQAGFAALEYVSIPPAAGVASDNGTPPRARWERRCRRPDGLLPACLPAGYRPPDGSNSANLNAYGTARN